MDKQIILSEILRKKGIGPLGSKCLKADDLAQLPALLKDDACSLTTKATLLTALLCLPPTKDESEFIKRLAQKPAEILPQELVPYIETEKASGFKAIVNKIINQQDLSGKEAEAVFSDFFSQPAYLQGSFLEAERLKRETFDENSAFLNVMRRQINPIQTDLEKLLDFGDSYDGNKRFMPLNLFVGCILAAMGYPCLLHGTDKVAPKEGVTHHAILKAAGKRTDLSLAEAVAKLKAKDVGWAYVDQSTYHPEIDGLKQVRKDMVKRPFLATFEKMVQPIRAQHNYMLTQYTHTHYKREIAKLVAAIATFDKVLHIKGIEGTSMLNPNKASDCVLLDTKGMHEIQLHGRDFNFSDTIERQDGFTAEDVLEVGLRVLDGDNIPERNFIQYQCVLILHYLFGWEIDKARYDVRQIIDSSAAKKAWNKF